MQPNSIKEINEDTAKVKIAYGVLMRTRNINDTECNEQAIYNVAYSIHRFSYVWCYTNRPWVTYYQSFLLFISGEKTALHEREIIAIHRYFGDNCESLSVLSDKYMERITAAAKHRQERFREIEANIKEQYKQLDSCALSESVSKINDFVEYSINVMGMGNHLLYVNLYNLGYMEGKRAERKRKNNKEIINDKDGKVRL